MDWFVIIFGLLFIVLVVVVLYLYVFPPCIEGYIFSNTTPRVELMKVLSDAKTGDLILLSGRSSAENLIKCVTRSPYSHVAMVVVEDGVPFLWESDIGQRTKTGVRVIKLRDKLALYKGHHIGMWLKFRDEERRPSNKDILPLIKKYIDMKMPDSMDYYLFSSAPDCYFYRKTKEEDKMYCSELVARSLQDLGLLSEEHLPAWYAPKTFLSLNELYHEPHLFDFKEVHRINKEK